MAAPGTANGPTATDDAKLVKEVIVSEKDRITLPATTTRAAGWQRGDHVLVHVVSGDIVVLMRKPTDWVGRFAGALSEVFGTSEETRAYLEHERQTWERPTA